VFVNVLVFLLAFFLDFFEIAFIIIPLIGPAADKIGIDLIWLGVMLGVNMQTSFMHPPFGFALFYLRSVAAKEPYKDRVTGAMTEPVTTGQIYWGAVPFVVIQCIMVGLVIAFPAMVMHYKTVGPQVDTKRELVLPPPPTDLPSPFGQPEIGGPPKFPGPPRDLQIPPPPPIGGIGQPPPSLAVPTPSAPSSTELPTAPSAPVPAPPHVDLGTPQELQPRVSPEPSNRN
jgi:hypothetical protein